MIIMSESVKICMRTCDNAIDYNEESESFYDTYEREGKDVADYQSSSIFVCRSSLRVACDDLIGAISSAISDSELLVKSFCNLQKIDDKKVIAINDFTQHEPITGSNHRRIERMKCVEDVSINLKILFNCANNLIVPKNLRIADTLKGCKVISEKTLKAYTQLYSLLKSLANFLLTASIHGSIEKFRITANYVGAHVTHKIDDVILDLQQDTTSLANQNTKKSTYKKQKKSKQNIPVSIGRQETIVPNLVFNMAQVDAKIVDLSRKYTTLEFSKALPRNVQRDFKFDENVAN